MINRTFMILDNNGEVLASELGMRDALDLLRLLALHNGVSSWTLATDYIECQGERPAPEVQEKEVGEGFDF